MATPDRQPQGGASSSGAAILEPHESLPLGESGRWAWFDDFLGSMLGGGIYLLGGSPGGRKSGLATQLAMELGAVGIPSCVASNWATAVSGATSCRRSAEGE